MEKPEEIKSIKLWGDKIKCNFKPYKPFKKPLAKLTTKPAVESDFVKDFNMVYKTPTGRVGTSQSVAPRSEVCVFQISIYNETMSQSQVKNRDSGLFRNIFLLIIVRIIVSINIIHISIYLSICTYICIIYV